MYCAACDALGKQIDCLRRALEWYGGEADAAARYMSKGTQTTADALLAILTVLANDGGRRSKEAIGSCEQIKSNNMLIRACAAGSATPAAPGISPADRGGPS